MILFFFVAFDAMAKGKARDELKLYHVQCTSIRRWKLRCRVDGIVSSLHCKTDPIIWSNTATNSTKMWKSESITSTPATSGAIEIEEWRWIWCERCQKQQQQLQHKQKKQLTENGLRIQSNFQNRIALISSFLQAASAKVNGQNPTNRDT